MAFRQLTEAECGQANPLVRLTTHLTRDHAFAEAHGQAFPGSSDQLVEQFLQETRAAPQTFRMDDLMREMHEIESQRAALPPVPASAVKDHLNDDTWAQQYLEDGKHFHINENHDAIWAEISAQDQAAGRVNPDEEAIWADTFLLQNEEAVVAQQSAREFIDNIDEPQFQYSKFMKFMQQVGDGETVADEVGATFDDEATAWGNEYVSNLVTEEDGELATNWSNEPVENKDEGYNTKFWDKLQDEWKKLSEQEKEGEHAWLSDFNEFYDSFETYKFSDDNPMFDVIDPLSRGKEMLSKGDLPSAVLCFEAAVKKEPDNSEAWQLLGKTQAENEQDPNAICALKKCVELQPDNQTALMALAISYTNENYPMQACHALVSWMRHHPRYSALVPPDLNLSGQVTSLIDPDMQRSVQDLFIRAAQQRPADVDYEVQCGLGVLFNLSSEFDKAVDCFKAALSVKPDDAKLWNRLGATFANSSRPEEAVDAYHKALSYEPGFIRARYNVGITCINLSAYKEAAEHFLLALNQQARGKDVKNMGGHSQISDTIWSSLRMVVSLMDRQDLRPALDNRDLGVLNKEFDIHE